MTSLFFTPWKGLMPNIKISHIQTPTERQQNIKTQSLSGPPTALQCHEGKRITGWKEADFYIKTSSYSKKHKDKSETERQKATDLNLPNIQTSLAVVNRLKLMDSGAIHLIGSFPLDAEKKRGVRKTVLHSVHTGPMNKKGALLHAYDIPRKVTKSD